MSSCCHSDHPRRHRRSDSSSYLHCDCCGCRESFDRQKRSTDDLPPPRRVRPGSRPHLVVGRRHDSLRQDRRLAPFVVAVAVEEDHYHYHPLPPPARAVHGVMVVVDIAVVVRRLLLLFVPLLLVLLLISLVLVWSMQKRMAAMKKMMLVWWWLRL